MLDKTIDLSPLRSLFPALQQLDDNGRPHVYFDGPGGTQVPQAVIDAMADYFTNANANCGVPLSPVIAMTKLSIRPVWQWLIY